MKVDVLTSRKVLFSGEAVEVILPAEEGEMSIWDFHQPCMCRLQTGRVSVKPAARRDIDQEPLLFPIKRGMARAGVQTLVVLVEDAGERAA